MARRRKHRLGSPADIHEQQAAREIERVESKTRQAGSAFYAGRCREAGQKIDEAYAAVGAAFAHLSSTSDPIPVEARVAVKTLKELDHQFEARCVRAKPED